MARSDTIKFVVNNVEYEFDVNTSGEFSFHMISTATPMGTVRAHGDPYDFWEDETYNYSDQDLIPNSLPVLLKVQELIISYIHQHHLSVFGFLASTDRKVRIFRWFAHQLSKKFPTYFMQEYPEGSFWFYRKS